MSRPGIVTAAPRRAGFTLVELIIAMVLTGIVLGAMYRVLNSNQRFYRAQGEVTELQQNLRAVALIVPGDLREVAASQGDISEMNEDNIVIRAMRTFSVVCAPPVPLSGTVILRNSLTFGYRAVDITRDSLLVFRDGDPDLASDDRWLVVGPSSTAGAVCTDGTAGTAYVVNGAGTSARTYLDSVVVGAPVRGFTGVRYSLYAEGSKSWLGVQERVSGTWTTASPVAGPLLSSGGIKFTYYDTTGAVTGDKTKVASVQITARGQSNNMINTTGRPTGYYRDSLIVRTAIRNN